MSATFVHPQGSHATQCSHNGYPPPSPGNHADIQAIAVPPPSQHWADCAEHGGDTLSQAVDCAEYTGVGTAVVEQDDTGWHGECSGCDLEEQDECDAEPYDGT